MGDMGKKTKTLFDNDIESLHSSDSLNADFDSFSKEFAKQYKNIEEESTESYKNFNDEFSTIYDEIVNGLDINHNY
jgi:hypothetical protein